MTEHAIGNLRSTPIPAIADRAARIVLEYASPRAVTVDPGGRCRVEAPDDAAEVDLIGVYERGAGLLGLSRMLIDDLRVERAARIPRTHDPR